ncbi:probable membrane-associated kinase regulator 4 [Impatiens glandulifera]|uniref:probable membrane-associated kinase regulator 4 n=1 Tax=Impatiens glandulifera TaxID=253017 RepID=UPI001FB1746A|nr:probable membrane-associated kinase regulator 4 [Impatiens glandulifera]
MATDLYDPVEEDYIDMEISSNFIFSPPHTREFEFQMFPTSSEKETTSSPADELFYKGKLLPLHFPPPLQMEKLLQNSKPYYGYDEFFSTPPSTTTNTTPVANNTPFHSCNISPAESCQISRELNPEEYSLDYYYSNEKNCSNGGDDDNPKKSWTKKLKSIKQSSLGSKLKASGAYIKSLFSKSGCSDESCTSAPRITGERSMSMNKSYLKNPFAHGQHHRSKTSTKKESREGYHRRSFSVAFKQLSTTKSFSSTTSSSSSSSNSNEFQELSYLRKSRSGRSDIENSIQGAIAYCKTSQQKNNLRKGMSEVGLCSLSAASIVSEHQERERLCRA